MIIGLAQMDIIWENKEENLIKAEQMIKDAVKEQIVFLLFPEMSLTGFSMNTNVIGEEREKSETLKRFSEFGKKYEIALGVGYVERSEDKAKNRYAIIHRNGEILLDYAKIHPFSYGEESIHYQGGDVISYATIEKIKTSSLICYDLRFPEIFQIASRKAQLITVAANWPKERREHWITLLKARAIENQCYIAGVNRIGIGNGIEYSGDSMIISPYGEILSNITDREGIVSAQIDSSIVIDYQEKFSLKDDRKEALYQKLSKSEV